MHYSQSKTNFGGRRMKQRNLEYENKFRAYLFKGDWKRYTEICKNLNVVESTTETRKAIKEVN